MSLRVAISKNAAPKLGVCCIVNTLTHWLCNLPTTPPLSVGQLLALNNVAFVVQCYCPLMCGCSISLCWLSCSGMPWAAMDK